MAVLRKSTNELLAASPVSKFPKVVANFLKAALLMLVFQVVLLCSRQMAQAREVAVALIGRITKDAPHWPKLADKISLRQAIMSTDGRLESHFFGCASNARRVVRMVTTRLLQRMIDQKKIGQSIGSIYDQDELIRRPSEPPNE